MQPNIFPLFQLFIKSEYEIYEKEKFQFVTNFYLIMKFM